MWGFMNVVTIRLKIDKCYTVVLLCNGETVSFSDAL